MNVVVLTVVEFEKLKVILTGVVSLIVTFEKIKKFVFL